MPNPIDFSAKTDRELLILVAQHTNDLADSVARMNNRLGYAERKLIRVDVIWKVTLALTATGGVGGGLWKLLG